MVSATEGGSTVHAYIYIPDFIIKNACIIVRYLQVDVFIVV